VNVRALKPGHVAAAAVMIGGLLVVALPQHGPSIGRLVVVTIAAAAGLHALAVNTPEGSATGWLGSPFDRASRAGRWPLGSDEIQRIRSKLSGRRQPIGNGPPLPPDALRLLQPLIRVALERAGLDPDDEAGLESVRARLSPLTWAVLTSDPMTPPDWYRTRRPDPRRVAEVAHRVLDELDDLAPSNSTRGAT
jgi:hypothetical protein